MFKKCYLGHSWTKRLIMDQEELLLVLHNKGGMREMEETGIYPDYLIFESTKYAKEWDRINLINRKFKGVLKFKRIEY